MDYYVLSNLMHNGESFKRGDRIELTEQFAAPLIEAGAIQAEPIDAEAAPVTPAQPAEPATVGGSAQTTGEPSLDGSQERTGADTATDITPKVDEKATEPEVPKPGFLGRILGGSGNESKMDETAPATPVVDPSANL